MTLRFKRLHPMACLAKKIKAFIHRRNIQVMHCDNCDKDTPQKVDGGGHERDSSHERFECTECGFVKYGLTGEWERP